MNKINPKKLLHSKWTAAAPKNKEKHFMIIELEINEDQEVECCVIEAVFTKRSYEIDWRDLKNTQLWLQGWK